MRPSRMLSRISAEQRAVECHPAPNHSPWVSCHSLEQAKRLGGISPAARPGSSRLRLPEPLRVSALRETIPCPGALPSPSAGLQQASETEPPFPPSPLLHSATGPRTAQVACGCCRPFRGRFPCLCWGPAGTPIPSTNLAPGHSPHTAPPPPVSRRRTPGCSIKSCLQPSFANRFALAGFRLLVADSQRGSASSARSQRDVF